MHRYGSFKVLDIKQEGHPKAKYYNKLLKHNKVNEITFTDKEGKKIMNNFQPLVNEVLNLDCSVFIEKLDKQIKQMASNPNVDIKHITDLIDIKYNYMNKLVQSMNKFKQLDSEQQMILYLYVLKNKSCDYLANRLKVSVRTFF